MKYAFYITVYENRYTEMLNNLKNLDNRIDIYIVAQQNDKCKDDYKEYLVQDRIKLLIPIIEGKNTIQKIARKRQYILEHSIENNYDGFFMCDDDTKFICETIKEGNVINNHYKRFKADFNEMINEVINVFENNECGMITVNDIYLGFAAPKQVKINAGIIPYKFVFINPQKLNEYNINYNTSGDIAEDIDLAVRIVQNGINILSVRYYEAKYANNTFGRGKNINTSTIWNDYEEQDKIVLNLYLKYRPTLKLKYNGSLSTILRYSNYFNTFKLPEIKDGELWRIANTKDIIKLKDYLYEHNLIRHKLKTK